MTELKEIPKLVRYVCDSCGSTSIQVEGAHILCQDCVNTFLARNVGLMQPEQPKLETVKGGVVPSESSVEGEGTG